MKILNYNKLNWIKRHKKRVKCNDQGGHTFTQIYCYHTGLAMYAKCEHCGKIKGSLFFNLI